MTEDMPMKHRMFQIEQDLADVKAQMAAKERGQGEIDTALLRRIDRFLDDLHSIKRDQRSSFDGLETIQISMINELDELKSAVSLLMHATRKQEQALEVLAETTRDHKAAIESVHGQVQDLSGQMKELARYVQDLALGQQHILALLTGNHPKISD